MNTRESLLKALWYFSVVRSNYQQPCWRIWDKLPEDLREKLKQLKSEDIKHDNWHLR